MFSLHRYQSCSRQRGEILIHKQRNGDEALGGIKLLTDAKQRIGFEPNYTSERNIPIYAQNQYLINFGHH